MKRLKLLYLLPLTLFGCDSSVNLAQICNDNPQICAEFKEDNYCKKERKNTILAQVALKKSPDDLHKYKSLIAYENYAKCMALASKIEHIKLKEKKTARINNLIKARARIKELSIETKDSNHPYLLYFHWSRYLDDKALAKFLKQEGSALLETPESQFNLATYYIKRDPDKTLALLFHALELYKPEQKINKEIFKSLSSIFTDKKEYKQAYIWLRVLALYDPKDKSISSNTLSQYSKTYGLDSPFLDKVAKSTLHKIEQGKFKAPKF
jgi:hypothetical protein